METSGNNIGSRSLFYGWLLFAISALTFAGIFAFLIAMARTPVIQNLFSGSDFVRTALVGHVNLAFVIWFLAFEGALWTLSGSLFLKNGTFSVKMGWAGLMLSAAGTAVIIISTLTGFGRPLFINYIPVLDHPFFYAGLLLIGAGILTTIINNLLTVWKARGEAGAGDFALVRFGLLASSVAALVALACFGLSYYFEAASYGAVDLETLFWGGGHILQFANTMAMVSVWLYMAGLISGSASIRLNYGKAVYAVFLLFVFLAPFSYLLYDITSSMHREFFTRLMEFGLGPSTGVFAAAILAGISADRSRGFIAAFKELPWGKAEFSSLAISMALFLLGGLISAAISGYNTKVPSHYHGAIGGVTMAFMGITYHLIGMLGREVYSKRAARIQPYIYGIGQTLFILGMFWAGSHGVARKTFGSAQHLDSTVKVVSMAVFGIGGLMAISGGVVFVVNAGISLLRGRPATEAAQ
ncbi:MAG: cbb3-type cytochrome c oxidase subunit I [Deltaproteobacteria bacterium]|nr:cbb3-type cytochrome c oxidase subunit I [Deltaproteobacteria bacterium]